MNSRDRIITLSDAKEVMTQRKEIENGIAAIEHCKTGMNKVLDLQDSSIFALINRATQELQYVTDENRKAEIINSIIAFQSEIIDVRLSMVEASMPIIDSFKSYIDNMTKLPVINDVY